MMLQTITVIITLVASRDAAMVPIEETDVQLTASDTDTGNWSADLGNMEINIEHKHDSIDTVNGTWTLKIGRASYMKDEGGKKTQEKEEQKSETVQTDNSNEFWYKDLAARAIPSIENEMPTGEGSKSSKEGEEQKSETAQTDDSNAFWYLASRTIRPAQNEMSTDGNYLKSYPLVNPNITPLVLPYSPQNPVPPMGIPPATYGPPSFVQTPDQTDNVDTWDSDVTVKGPYNFELFKGVGWFKFDKRDLTWDEAREACEEVGAHLAVPDTPNRMRVLGFLAKRHNDDGLRSFASTAYDQTYVGISDPDMNRIFKTVEGKPFNPLFTIWDDPEPNNLFSREYCVAMFSTGRINDVPCDYQLPFICEKNIQN